MDRRRRRGDNLYRANDRGSVIGRLRFCAPRPARRAVVGSAHAVCRVFRIERVARVSHRRPGHERHLDRPTEQRSCQLSRRRVRLQAAPHRDDAASGPRQPHTCGAHAGTSTHLFVATDPGASGRRAPAADPEWPRVGGARAAGAHHRAGRTAPQRHAGVARAGAGGPGHVQPSVRTSHPAGVLSVRPASGPRARATLVASLSDLAR
jgi:hypothetical protein